MRKIFVFTVASSLLLTVRAGLSQARDDLVDPAPSLSLDTIPMDTLLPVPSYEGAVFDSNLGFVGNFKAVFDLKDEVDLGWHSESGSANLDAVFGRDTEHIINTEDFSLALEKIVCTKPIVFTFRAAEDLDEALNKWSWVNEKPLNRVFLVTTAPACSKDGRRVVFAINQIRYDKSQRTITLDAVDASWDQIIQEGEITAESYGGNNGFTRRTLQRRGGEAEAFGVHRSFVGSIYSQADGKGNKFDLQCVDCGADVEFNVKTRVSIGAFKINIASITVTANANARARLGIEASGSIRTANQKPIWSNTYGISVPGVVKFGIGPTFGINYNAGINGSGSLTFGAAALLTPNSQATLCLKGCDSSKSGWNFTLQKDPPQYDGTLKADLDIYPYTNLVATAQVFSSGYSADLSVQVPRFKGTLTAQANQTGYVCGNKDYHFGLTAAIQAGVTLLSSSNNNIKELYSKYFDLYDQCHGFA